MKKLLFLLSALQLFSLSAFPQGGVSHGHGNLGVLRLLTAPSGSLLYNGSAVGVSITDSASLRSLLSDESGTGAAIFAGGALGAATATSINGLTITTSTGTVTITNGKTLTASNTITLTATDGSTLAIGTGGTLGTAAYTASTDYAAAASITGGGVLATAGFTLTLPATGTAALLGTANTFTALQSITPATPGSALAITSGTVTTSLPFLTATQTWNAAAVFTGALLTYTETSASANSAFFSIMGGAAGATNRFTVRRNSATVTDIAFGTSSFSTIIRDGANGWVTVSRLDTPTVDYVALGNNSVQGVGVTSGGGYFWASSTTVAGLSGGNDTFMLRAAAASVQLGQNVNGAAVNQTFKSHDGITGTDISGANLTVASGNSTGSATSAIIMSTPQTGGGSGTTARTASERMRVSGDGVTIGSSGNAISSVIDATATLDFASTGSGAVADLTITVTGAALNDDVVIGVPHGSVTATATFSAWVSSADTVTVRFSPKATEDPASGTFSATVIKN